MKISVTQSHIDRGTKEDGEACPIAIAILESLPSAKSVQVDESEVTIDSTVYPLPAEAIEFVDRLDNNLHVEPIEFELDEFGLAGVDYCGACGMLHALAAGCGTGEGG